MSFELRLATLEKLLDNPSEPVKLRLAAELRLVEKTLAESTEYGELERALKTLAVLAPKFHGAVIPLLRSFVKVVRARRLLEAGEPIQELGGLHRSSSHLIREAIDVPGRIRYVQQTDFIDFLMDLAQSPDEAIRSKARKSLQSFAEFDLEVFGRLGAGPQTVLVAKLSALRDEDLFRDAETILPVLGTVLASSMEGRSWTYNTLTISRADVRSGSGVEEMRAAAIALLKRMYPLSPNVVYRKSVLSALNAATHRDQPTVDAHTKAMFERDVLAVLEFKRELVATEALPIIQTIEHDVYWNYVHAASPAIEVAALGIRDALGQNAEYQIYKQLIGFEGIFGQWEKLRGSEEAWDYTNTKRQEAARRYAGEIGDHNQDEWQSRILEFSKTESDDLAMFPVFYDFLRMLGEDRPSLALELVTRHESQMRPFLIPLIGGLWVSERRADVDLVVQRWIANGSHLEAIAKSLLGGGAEQLAVLSSVVARSCELENRGALIVSMGVAASFYAKGVQVAKEVFMHALQEMAKRHDGRWAKAFWFGRDFKALVMGMDDDERTEVLSSMTYLPALDYQTEEILHAIGSEDLDAVLRFLRERLSAETQERANPSARVSSGTEERYEAIPYHLHGLKKLLEPHPKEVVGVLRNYFDDESARLMFPYRGGARLVKAVFPGFEGKLQNVLLELIQTGDIHDHEFVAAVVRAYGGSAPILDVCKALVRVTQPESAIWRELAAAIETTGGVWGEYGLVKAYEGMLAEISSWSDDEDESLRVFAEWLTGQLERIIAFERQRADEDLALRKYKFGEGSDEGPAAEGNELGKS